MPAENRSQAGGRAPRLRAQQALLSALALLAVAGCLDLSLPTVPATPPAPFLTVATPQPGDTIALTQQVSASAASVNGIGSVSVLCGPLDAGARTLYTWVAPPYLAFVNFALCQGATTPNADGGYPILGVTVRALSDAGAEQDVSFDVFLNAVGPILAVQYPPTVQPKSPFQVQVSSNETLRSFPTVLLDLSPADSVTAVGNPADGGYYLAQFFSAPGLGTDNYDGGLPVPIEVLTDTDQTVRLTVSGTDATSGNTTELDLSVELTRVVWDRYIPGQPATSSPVDWAAEPLAFDGGLMLPLATAAPASATSSWLPGRLDFVDGTFFGFQPAVGQLDAGYQARAINSAGQTLFVNFTGNFTSLLLAPFPPLQSPVVQSAGALGTNPPLTRVDTLLCLQDGVTVCSGETIESLVCLDPQLNQVTATSAVTSTGPPDPGVVAGAGGRYLSPNVGVCGSSWNLVDLGLGTVSFGPLADPNGIPGCSVDGISKLFAVGDGTFVVQLQESCGVTAVLPPQFPILRVGAESAILGAYTAPLGTPALLQQEVVGVLVDGRVVTLSNAPPDTNFELWSLNASTPDVVTSISGLYDSADAVLGSVLAKSSYSGPDGSFAVLLSGNTTFGAAVAAFSPNLQARYLYLYPRIANATSTRLVSGSVGDVYLVDEINNHAVSLRVVPPQQPATPPDAGSGSAAAGIYISQGDNSVLVFSLTASGDTAPLRTLSGSLTGLSLPIGLAEDSQGNLYVANRLGSTVTVYGPQANGNVSPVRTLSASGMGSPQGLAMAVGDELFVSTCPGCGSSAGGQVAVFHFPAQSTASDYSIAGGNTDLFDPGSIALGDNTPGVGQILYVANSFGFDVANFPPNASGNVPPSSSFNPFDEEANIQSVAYGGGTLFLGLPGVGVGLFPASATGVPNPSSALSPPGFAYPGGIAVDVTVNPPVVYLVDFSANALYVIHTLGELPNLTIQSVDTLSGSATGLAAPLGVLVVK